MALSEIDKYLLEMWTTTRPVKLYFNMSMKYVRIVKFLLWLKMDKLANWVIINKSYLTTEEDKSV